MRGNGVGGHGSVAGSGAAGRRDDPPVPWTWADAEVLASVPAPGWERVRRAGRMGERAVLIETDGTASALALYDHLQRHPMDHQSELVPGARSVLVRFSRPIHAGEPLGVPMSGPSPAAEVERTAGDEIAIEVVYDGADLDEVGDLTGLGPDGVVTAHTGAPWQVAFCGFSPGFGYLTGGDRRLTVPRRDTPRERVPAGSVGLAGEYSGIYPSASPAGWQIIGRTGARLWDIDRDPPALLRPGMTVRFHAVRDQITTGGSPTVTDRHARGVADPAATDQPVTAPPGRALTVINPGIQCTVQDLGRPGLADMGVSPSGAADRGAAIRANRIVGNEPGAGVLEILLGGTEFRAEDDLLVAVTGAPVSVAVDTGAPSTAPAGTDPPRSEPVALAPDRPVPVPAGARITLGRPTVGLRSYLAVRGGIAVAPVLGSRSTDLLAGIGPAAPSRGGVLPIGEDHWGTPHPVPAPVDLSEVLNLKILPGPQLDWFDERTLAVLTGAEWTVSPASSRVGIRLTGPELRRAVTGELLSQGLVRGAVQVPPSGELVVFLADHPVTGGYPVIAVLAGAALDLAAQARPGATVRLCRAGPAPAAGDSPMVP